MIRVIDSWVIDVDAKQYVVGKLSMKKNKDGKLEEYITNPSYYSDLPKALTAISKRLRAEALFDADGDLTVAMKAIKEADARMLQAVSAYKDVEVVFK